MISQKTVSKLDTVLGRLFLPGRFDRIPPLWTWKAFRRALYEREFSVQTLDYLEQEYRGNPSRFLPRFYDGTIPAYLGRGDGYGQPDPNDKDRLFGQKALAVMIEVVLPVAEATPVLVEPPHPWDLCVEVITSLREDGLDFIGGKVVPAAMKAVDLKKEDEYLIAIVRAIKPPNMDEIQHHHDESDKAFANAGWGAASSEARNFLIATLRGLREVATTRGKVTPYKQPGKDGPLIEDFKTIGLFTDAEKDAVMHVWVLLCHAGPHVGIKEEDTARLSRLLAIGMIEWVALKFITWEKNGFKQF